MTLWLARHGAHATVDSLLLGRTDDAGLSAKGFAEAQDLAARLTHAGVKRVETSPRRRCRETAMVVATALGCPLSVAPALEEVDFGSWSGRRFEELAGDPRWQRWNAQRSSVRPPGGESIGEARRRMMDHVRASAAQSVLMVTHAELIRAVLLTRDARPLDAWHTVIVPTGGLFALEEEDLALESLS